MANYTIKAIMQNFAQMLEEMPFNKITVSALVERCGISPNTFYYHFRDIYDLLDHWFFLQVEQYINPDSIERDWAASLKTALKAMQQNPKVIYHIWENIPKERLEQFAFGPAQDWFSTVLQKRLGGAGVSDTFIRGATGFYCYTILGFVLHFLWDHMQADVDAAVDQLGVIFSGVTAHMIEQAAPPEKCAPGRPAQKTPADLAQNAEKAQNPTNAEISPDLTNADRFS